MWSPALNIPYFESNRPWGYQEFPGSFWTTGSVERRELWFKIMIILQPQPQQWSNSKKMTILYNLEVPKDGTL